MWMTALIALSLAAADGRPVTAGQLFASANSAETLGSGGAQLALSAGFPALTGTYLQALSDGADLGAVVEFDWATTEFVVGGVYRALLSRSGATTVAWRTRVGFYADLGSSLIYDRNGTGAGIQLMPGVVLSNRMGGGIVSLAADVPVNVTAGLALGPRFSAAFEAPLWEDLLVGFRGGTGLIWSTDGAPFGNNSPRTLLELSLLLSYRLF